ncbi:MAG: hypothetical protein Q7V88_05620 [Actinomycetota bacterium]|nr:hypothetical protein [Actinomycetota bacterium]
MKRTTRLTTVAMLSVALLLAACSDDGSQGGATTAPSFTIAPDDTAPEPAGPIPDDADTETIAAVQAAVDGAPGGCDPLDTTRCLLPFPSNAYTNETASTDTNRRVAIPAAGLPANADGVPIDPTEWNRNDGFSPNTPILAHLPGLDAEASRLPKWTDIGSSLADDATVVILDLDTGERIPLWAELDAHAETDDERLLTIRPAISLPEGHTFAVALRGMLDADRGYIEPSPAFRVFRDYLLTGIEAIEFRRGEMEAMLVALTDAGINRAELQLAWTFTVASTRNISERMLHIRDEALAELGDVAPVYMITSETPNTDDDIAVQVEGTYTVPNYLTGDGGPGQSFNYDSDDADALPVRNGTIQATFVCNISVATMNGTEPAHLVLYGHGLLGDHHEIDAGNVRAMSNEHNVVHCATKWAGMSEDDIGNAATTLGEFSNFDTMADRLQQGVLNQIFLGRLMTRPGGLGDSSIFRRADGTPLIDTAHLDYDGNSQGGVMGLMLAAVSPDIERAVLGVPGMNYSLLLPRSVDFDTYEAIFEPAYPSDLDRLLILGATQMLWDRGEGGGYVQHLTADPYPGTPAKTVLLDVAFGDHQVSELSALIEARTIGAAIHQPVAIDGRWAEKDAGWGLEPITYPFDGSAIIVWDSGMEPIPFENLAPREGDDSHEDPRRDPDVRAQKAAFLFDDTLVDVCDGAACQADHNP